MRGLLYILLLSGAVLVLGVYVVLPAVAAGLLTAGVTGAGLQAADTVVRVHSNPPWDLLGLNADQVQVRATHATLQGIAVGSVAVDFTDVSVLGRTAGTVAGRLDAVDLPGVGSHGLQLATVTLAGTGGPVTATSTITAAAAASLIADDIAAALGTRPTAVTLSAPDAITVRLGSSVTGHVSVTATGNIVVRLEGGSTAGRDLVLVAAAAAGPFRVTSVTVTPDGGLRIVGELAVGLLG